MRGSAQSRVLIYLLLALALSACGFRLAGNTSLPQELARIHLITTDFSEPQRDALLARLRRAGAEVALEPLAQAMQLRVRLEVLPNRRLLTSASDGTTVERVARALEFSLKDMSGDNLVAGKTIRQQKDIVLDQDNLLSSTVERENVIQDMESALFNQLIHQLKRI